MLIRFSVSNIRSINDRQELSMVPSAFFKEHKEMLLNTKTGPLTKLLPSAVIYGPNASGKSNVIAAVRFLQAAVLSSHSKGKPEGGVPRSAFALKASCLGKPTSMEIEFLLDGTRYQYGFEASDKEFPAEWLYSFPRGRQQLMFERTSGRNIRFGRALKGQNNVISKLMRPNSLFVSAAAQNDHEQLLKIHKYIESIAFDTVISQEAPAVYGRLSQVEFDPRIIHFLQKIGTGVIGFRKKKAVKTAETEAFDKELRSMLSRHLGQEIPSASKDKLFQIELAHQSDTKEKIYFDLQRESAGTRRLLVVLSSVFHSLDAGTALFVDELDASLHTQVGEGILALFANRATNKKGAQLVATTHDTNLMCSKYLRRDQIWFTEKDLSGATHLFPLTDIRTRNTDNIEKGYLQGRYGAIPFAGNLAELLVEC